MAEQQNKSTYPKTAACSCGALTLAASAAPKFVHTCACLDCQRATGSAFSYSAFFAEDEAKITGDPRRWRTSSSEAGRWSETSFCPTCGVTLFSRLEALPGMICVPVGGFGDPNFEKPGKMFWSSRRHRWLDVPNGVEPVETQ